MKNFIYQQSANYFNTWAFVYVLRNRIIRLVLKNKDDSNDKGLG
ncbi:hypothetical protein [Helicobacter pylori]|nr:hypothetical protein [Helicobacter pylori]